MVHSIKRNLANRTFVKIGSIIYSIIMLLCYYAYIILEHYKMNKSELWLSKSSLTQNDLKSIEYLSGWTSKVEVLFIFLFITGFIVFRYIFPEKSKNLKIFLLLNVCLFIFIFLIGYMFFSESVPVGNIIQPTIFPSIILIFMFVYFLWTRKRS